MAEQQALDVARWFLALFFPGVALFYILRLTVRRRELGRSAVSHGDPGSRHWWLAKTFVVFRAAITLAMLGRALWPGLDGYLLAMNSLMIPAVVFTGLGLLIGSFSAVVALHFWMGEAWRSGLTASDDSLPLLTEGPFAWSRNPMFLCIQGAQLGLFLAFPSGFTLLCFAVGVIVLHLQVRLEEAHLQRLHGEMYRDYAARTPRWLSLRHLLEVIRAQATRGRKTIPH